MTSQEAANFLGFSRQFLVGLLDEGKIPFHRAGTHRRVYLQDLIAFRKERDRRRHEAIEDMVRDAVKDGVFDDFRLPAQAIHSQVVRRDLGGSHAELGSQAKVIA